MALSPPSLFLLSCLLSVLLTPFSMSLAVTVHAIDTPDGGRKIHLSPTPRLGGVAVFLSVALTALFLLPSSPTRDAWLTGGALLSALGISDDIFSLSPRLKLFAMSAILLLPVCFGLAPNSMSVGDTVFPISPVLGGCLAFLWTLALANAFNLIDGLDGLAATQGIVVSLFLSLSGDPLAALFGGTLFGFLPYNRTGLSLLVSPPKKIPTRSFLGDTGALFTGYSLALLSLGDGNSFSVFLPLLFALPLCETLSSFFRRLRKGKNPFSADRDHLHHRLLKAGYSPTTAVFLLFLYALLFGSLFFLTEAVFPLF